MSRTKTSAADVSRTADGLRDAQHERFKALARLAMMAGGAGMGVAGLQALPGILDSTPDDTLEAPEDNYVAIGNVQPKKLVHKYPLPKVANVLDSISSGLSSAKDRIVEAVIPAEDNAGPFTGYTGPLLMAGAAAIPAYAGYKGVRSLLSQFSENSRDAELEEAKRKFEKARAAQYAQMLRQKSGLDSVYEKREELKEAVKAASSLPTSLPGLVDNAYTNTWGKLFGSLTGTPSKEAWKTYIGSVLAGSAAVGGAGYLLGKGMTSTSTKEQLKKKIMKQRAAARSDASYAALPATYAIPVESRTLKEAALRITSN